MCSFHQFRSILTVWTVRTVRRTLLPFKLVEQFYENKKSSVKHPRYDAPLPIFSCFGNNGFDAGIRFRNIIQYTKFYLYGVIYRGLIGLIWGMGKHVIINTNKPFLYTCAIFTGFLVTRKFRIYDKTLKLKSCLGTLDI